MCTTFVDLCKTLTELSGILCIVGWQSKLSLIIFIDVAAATVVPAKEIGEDDFKHQYCRLLSTEEKIAQRHSFIVFVWRVHMLHLRAAVRLNGPQYETDGKCEY